MLSRMLLRCQKTRILDRFFGRFGVRFGMEWHNDYCGWWHSSGVKACLSEFCLAIQDSKIGSMEGDRGAGGEWVLNGMLCCVLLLKHLTSNGKILTYKTFDSCKVNNVPNVKADGSALKRGAEH